MSVKYQRIGCGGQCPVNGVDSSSIGFIPNQNKLIAVNSSVKVAKGIKKKYDTGIIYLSPYWSFDGSNNLCPSASPGCRSTCLVTSGQLKNPTPKQAQLDKTNYWLSNPNGFLSQAHKEIESLVNTHSKKGANNLTIRLNGTSDIPFEKKSYTYDGKRYSSLMDAFPNVQFYDYTKIYDRLGNTPKNYHLTFSASEINTELWNKALKRGFQVAMVFGSQPGKTSRSTGLYIKNPQALPKVYQGYKVVDGDNTDLTFLQPNGVIIGLRMKGKAENDTTGFVKRDYKQANTNYPKLNPKTNIPNIITRRSSKAEKPHISVGEIKNTKKILKNKPMARFKKGSLEAKKYMASIRKKKGNVGKIERVNRRSNTTYVHISRKPKVKRKTKVKRIVKRVEITTLMPLRNLQLQDTFTLGKLGKLIYERGYKIPNKDAYECFTLSGKKVIKKGSIKVNLIDSNSVSGYVHTKKRGRKSTLKYTHPKIGSHNNIGNVNQLVLRDYEKVVEKIGIVENSILHNKVMAKYNNYTKEKLKESKRALLQYSKYLKELKTQRSELKKFL